jgi:hypothetical protein
LLGANLSSLSLAQLQAINGPLSITFDGFRYDAVVNLAGVASFADAANDIRDALASAAPRAAATTGSRITPESVSFTGHTGKKLTQGHLYVTSVGVEFDRSQRRSGTWKTTTRPFEQPLRSPQNR